MQKTGSTHQSWNVLSVLALAFAVWCGVGPARAETYPSKPVRLVVPFPAGGGGDTLARTIVGRLSRALGQAVVVENRPGAGGNIGAEAVAKSAPDGYTLLYGTNGTHAINPSLYREVHFDPAKDFAPVSRMSEIALMLVVNPAVPANSTSELLRYLKANPGKVNFGSAGNGTTSHLAGELFQTMTGVEIVHMPFRGGGPAMVDLLAGRVSMMIEIMANVSANVKAGKLRGLAVSTHSRFPSGPEIPTMAESGVPGFELSAWDAIFAPVGTPKPIVDRLNAAVRETLADPQVREALLSKGATAAPTTPEQLGKYVVTEREKWAKIVKKSGATID